MKRHFWLILLVCSLCPSLFAQKKNPVTTVIKEILPRQAKNLQGAVETMAGSSVLIVTIRPSSK